MVALNEQFQPPAVLAPAQQFLDFNNPPVRLAPPVRLGRKPGPAFVLTPEERERRKRARWARQCAARRQNAELKNYNPHSHCHRAITGVPERAICAISPAEMAVAENYFWSKRGFTRPPGVTSGGVMPSAIEHAGEAWGARKANHQPDGYNIHTK